MDMGIDITIGTIITTLIISKLQLNNSYYGVIFSLLIKCVKEYQTILDIIYKSINLLNKTYLIISTISILLIFIFKRFDLKWGNSYITLKLYKNSDIIVFLNFMKYHPEFFDKDYNVEYGNKKYECGVINSNSNGSYYLDFKRDINSVEVDQKLYYRIPDLKIHGYVVWQECSEEITVAKEKQLFKEYPSIVYPTIYINKGANITCDEFYNIMIKYNNLSNNNVSLSQIKILGRDMKDDSYRFGIYQIRYEKRRTIEEYEDIYISTFFHREKNRIWKSIKDIQFNIEDLEKQGKPCQSNMLLYGPPGSGKSSFAYRIAMCMNRNIINLDIRDITCRVKLNNLLRNAGKELSLNKKLESKDVVYVFEEFDIGIKTLMKRSEENKRLKEMYEKKVSSKMNKKYSVKNKEDEGDKKDKSKSQISTIDIDSKFTINDLLDIFQGTVPNRGAIIIATTNDYEGIKAICPALFRPGRLTPVYFGYANKETLNQITQFYYKRDFLIDVPNEISTPTSEIIQIALESLSDDNPYEYFLSKLDFTKF